MELLSKEIYNLRISNSSLSKNFIQKFSLLNLKSLHLDNKEEVLVGHIIFQTDIQTIHDYTKKLFIAKTSYYTHKKYKIIYPLHNILDIAPIKIIDNPHKYFNNILKERYKFPKSIINKIQIFEIYNKDNVVI